jgi:hypothetical protein
MSYHDSWVDIGQTVAIIVLAVYCTYNFTRRS